MSARYAEIAIRAAVSAAQEERDEMALLLEHAREPVGPMSLGGGTPAEWPLPIDELEGELWLEVDRVHRSARCLRARHEAEAHAQCLDRPGPLRR